MDIRLSDDDVVEIVQTVVGVLAEAEEIDREGAAAILCEEHDGDGERLGRIVEQAKAALEHIFADRAMNDAKLGGIASKYMPDPTTGSPDCRSAE
jgi:hypothetical protein